MLSTENYEKLESLLEHYNYACQCIIWDAADVSAAIDASCEAKRKIMSFVEELCT